ncbi:NAD-dependent epimerase/dehydratase family protein [Candidatus Daviesbacteria bacterium]|nr:NAD-dependent epimerase/dehydratase family protein [Candidatus Daviesbacteria bacterium]
MRSLVTGGAGFIGSHIQDKLLELGHDVAVVDNLSSGKKEYINPQAKLFEIDITNGRELKKAAEQFHPDFVFHLAAQVEVPYSMTHPLEDQNINIVGTINLLEAVKELGVKKVIYSNTGGAFYGDVDQSELPIDEDCKVLKPTSFYGVSKQCAESYLKLYGNLYNIPWVSLRYANVYGPRQEGNKEAGVVAIFTTKLLNGDTPTINGDGKHTRDYVFVMDVVEANIKAMEYSGSDYCNISTGVETSTQEVFDTLKEYLKSSITPNYGPPRAGDAFRVCLSPKKAGEKLDWKATTNFKDGVKKTVDFYQNLK